MNPRTLKPQTLQNLKALNLAVQRQMLVRLTENRFSEKFSIHQ